MTALFLCCYAAGSSVQVYCKSYTVTHSALKYGSNSCYKAAQYISASCLCHSSAACINHQGLILFWGYHCRYSILKHNCYSVFAAEFLCSLCLMLFNIANAKARQTGHLSDMRSDNRIRAYIEQPAAVIITAWLFPFSFCIIISLVVFIHEHRDNIKCIRIYNEQLLILEKICYSKASDKLHKASCFSTHR